MVKFVNRVKVVTTTTGTGTITLGAAVDGFQSFANAGVANGDTVRYVIEDGDDFEIGTGTYTSSGTTLSRSVAESSNSNNLLNLTGNAIVFVSAVAVDIIPSGVIVLWSGAVAGVPTGWFLCDGANGTPDLRDRFVVGSGTTYTPGNTGGANTITLTSSEIPGHTHTFSTTADSNGAHTHTFSATTGSDGAHTHTFSATTNTVGDHDHTYDRYLNGGPFSGISPGSFATRPFARPPTSLNGSHSHSVSGTTASNGAHTHSVSGTTASDGAHTHTVSGTTASTGGGSAHENRPPYYALAYIMKG
jgi:microcystin-dependent protein